MNRKENGAKAHDLSREKRADAGREANRLPASHRDRARGDSPRREGIGRRSPRLQRDRVHGDSRGRVSHVETQQRQVTPSPVRGYHQQRKESNVSRSHRSPDKYKRSSADLHASRDLSREQRMESPARRSLPRRSPKSSKRHSSPLRPVRRGSPVWDAFPRPSRKVRSPVLQRSPRAQQASPFHGRSPPRPRSPVRHGSHLPPLRPGSATRRTSPLHRLPIRPGSPHMRRGSPMRHESARMRMRPGSPLRLPVRPLSPQLPIGRSSDLSAGLHNAVDYAGANARDVVLASARSGAMPEPQTAAAFTSVTGGKIVGDMINNNQEESLNSYGMLVPGSIVLEDGTVRTFYSLPPDPVSSSVPPVDPGVGGKLLPPYSNGVHQYGMDSTKVRYNSPGRVAPLETFRSEYPIPPERIVTDRELPNQYSYPSGDRIASGWRDKTDIHLSSYRPDRPLSPYHRENDRVPERRVNPLRDELRVYGRDGPDLLREPYQTEMERSGRRFMEQRTFGHAPEHFRHGQISPQRRPPHEEFRGNEDGIGYPRRPRPPELGFTGEGRVAVQRGSLLEPVLDRGFEHQDSLMYQHANGGFCRSGRSPHRDFPRYLERPTYKSGGQLYLSPSRNDPVSPRRMRSLTPPYLHREIHGDDRSLWKRKHMEYTGRSPFDWSSHEPEFKRRQWDVNMNYDNQFRNRKISGWDVKDKRFDGRIAREGNWNPSLNKVRDERDVSPWSQRRHPQYFEEWKRRENVLDRERRFRFDRHGRNSAEKVGEEGETYPTLEQDIPPDLPEDSAEFKQQVQRTFLKYTKVLNEDREQRKKYEEQGKGGMLPCLACGRMSKLFVDMHGLIMHTVQSQKKGLRAEHLGLCRALCIIMGWNSATVSEGGKDYQNISAEDAKANSEDLILWPPAVIIHSPVSNTADGRREDVSEAAINSLLEELGLSVDRIKVSIGRHGTTVIKYTPTFSCLREAERLHEHFLSNFHGRDDWVLVESVKELSSDGTRNIAEGNNVLYGYLGLAQDLNKVDSDFQRRCVIRSRKEIDAIASDVISTDS